MTPAPAKSESPLITANTRSGAPVFVVGCPRSGTTLLYHMLLSAGGFAIYRSESNVFNLLAPRFSGMRSLADRKALLDFWLKSKLFEVSGLNAHDISARITSECRNPGDFLRIVMQEVAVSQKVARWADCTPEHLLYVDQIKREIPEALFIHIIRDGRDVALSYEKQGWIHPLPWDRNHNSRLAVAGLYWEWLVRNGRERGKALGSDYQEVRFEDLIDKPQQTLARLGSFIDHDLDYERIRQTAIGSVQRPNTSFAESEAEFDPVARWKSKMSAEQIEFFDGLVGDFLLELGYSPLAHPNLRANTRASRMRAKYFFIFAAKHWMRTRTPVARLVRLERVELTATEKLNSRNVPSQNNT